ncbi:MAG: glycosyltransferase [Acidobacteriota bacterium]
MQVSAIIVHYRAPELAAEAARAVADDCDASAVPWEVLVVDNGDDPGERARLEAGLRERLPDRPWRILVPGENLGYAGGLRVGVDASRGELLLLMNPDVLVCSGCVDALVRALDAGATAAGPRFFWDRERRMLLPPAEERTRTAALLSRLARTGPRAARAVRRRWRRHARRHWEAGEVLRSEALSGALLAVRRSVWRDVGPFDDAFRLYFEETDWLRRLVRRGGAPVQVPAAEAVHLYDRSAASEPRSPLWFRRSQALFERRWYGRGFAALLSALDRLPERSRKPGGDRRAGGPLSSPPAGDATLEIPVPGVLRPPLWVEMSPSPLGFPAAAERVEPDAGCVRWRLPEEIWDRLPPGRFRLQLTGANGAEGPSRWLHKPAPAPMDRR